jgi:hypothetical protein
MEVHEVGSLVLKRGVMDYERRQATRKPLQQEIMLSHDKGFRLCKLHDISTDGALLDIGWGVLTRNVSVELSLNLPDDPDKKTYHVNGFVTRVSTDGTAVRFESLTDEVYHALSRYLDMRG